MYYLSKKVSWETSCIRTGILIVVFGEVRVALFVVVAVFGELCLSLFGVGAVFRRLAGARNIVFINGICVCERRKINSVNGRVVDRRFHARIMLGSLESRNWGFMVVAVTCAFFSLSVFASYGLHCALNGRFIWSLLVASVADAMFGELGFSRFVAGAVFGDLGLLLFVAVKLDRPLTFLLWHWSLLMKRGTRKKTESRLSQCLLLSSFSPIFCKLGWAWNRRRVGTWCASGRGV